jgi:hypothetical protein
MRKIYGEGVGRVRSKSKLTVSDAERHRQEGGRPSTDGAAACPPGTDARLAAIRRLLLDETLAARRPHRRLPCRVLRPAAQQNRRAAHLRHLLRRRRHPSQARRGLARRARACCRPAPAPPARPRQHDHRSQPGLAVAVSRAARRRTPQLPPPRPRPLPARHPRPGNPAGRLARTRPPGTTRRPGRRARRLARHSHAATGLRSRIRIWSWHCWPGPRRC